MGRVLYKREPVFRFAVEECDRIAARQQILPYGVISTIFPPQSADANKNNNDVQIDDTAYAQPLLFVVGYALTRLLHSRGIDPDVVMGHSLGEYLCAVMTGVFTLETGMHMVAVRALAMSRLPSNEGVMVATRVSEDAALEAMRGLKSEGVSVDRVSVAAINGPKSVVISGSKNEVELVLARLETKSCKYLAVSHAFHSPLMLPAVPEIKNVSTMSSLLFA